MKRITITLMIVLASFIYYGTLTAQVPQVIGSIEGVPAVDKDFGVAPKGLAKGDVNGDGYTDLVVGSRGPGKIYIYLGDILGIDGTADVTFNLPAGLVPGTYFAHSVAVGDLNGDGFDDVVTGAPFTTIDGAANAGNVYVYFGAAVMDTTLDLDIPCPHPFKTNAYFGKTVIVGHFDKDNFDDLYVAASRGSIWGKTPFYRPGSYYDGPDAETYHGIVFFFAGSATFDGTYDMDPIIGQSSSGQAGDRAMDLGDVNGDGYDDLLLGEHGASYNHNNIMEECGKVTLYLGGKYLDHGPDLVIPKQDTTANYEFFGNSLANAGDVNGDGFDDLVVGLNPYGGQQTGKVYLFWGPLRKLDADMIIYPPAEVAELNKIQWGTYNGVAGLGDINGDGFGDFLVNGYMENNEDGKAYIFLGGTAFKSSDYFSMAGEAGSMSRFGSAGMALGDITGDGINDFLISAPNYGKTGSGKLYLYAGSKGLKVGVAASAAEKPSSYSVKQNYPNPFNPRTSIEFELPKSDHVILTIYNNMGKLVKTILDEDMSMGFHRIDWDGKDASGNAVSSGVYFYQIKTNGVEIANKMTLLK